MPVGTALCGANAASAWLPVEKSTDSSGLPGAGVTRAAVRNAASPTSVSFPNGFAANTRSTYDVSSASPAPNSGRSNTSAPFASAL